MDSNTKPARDALAASSPPADQLISLIMSGEKPSVNDEHRRETRAIQDAAATDGVAFWADPPDVSQPRQPGVEAELLRGSARNQTRTAPRLESETSATREVVGPVTRTTTSSTNAVTAQQLVVAAPSTTPTTIEAPAAQPELVHIPGVERLVDQPPRDRLRTVAARIWRQD